MAFLAVDLDGTECIFSTEPDRDFHPEKGEFWNEGANLPDSWGRIELPKGSIFKLVEKNISWKDLPLEIK